MPITRISTTQFYQDGLNGILNNQNAMYQAMQEITSGKKDLSPYDQAQVEITTVSISRQAQMLKSNDWLNHSLDLQDTALQDAQNYMLSIHDLSNETGNPTVSDTSSYKEQAKSLRDGLINALNAKNENGEYIFSGFSATVKPFDSNGQYVATGNSRMTYISDNTLVKSSLDSQDFSSNEIATVVQHLNDYISGTTPDLTSAGADIDNAISKISLDRAKVGLTMNQADNVKSIIQDNQTTDTAKVSQLQDVDYASAISQFNQAQTAYQASLKTMAIMNTANLFSYINA